MSEDLTGSYDSDLLKEVNARHHEAEPGVQAMRQIDQTEQDAQAVEDDNKFQATYDSSPVSSQGPSNEDYDYRAAYDGGMTFSQAGEGKGVALPNKHYRPGRLNIGGYDAQGTRMKSTFPDEDGLIQQGAAEFGNGVTDSADGPDTSSLKPLTKSALGMLRDGATFNDFVQQSPGDLQGFWNAQQKRTAWKNAEVVDAQIRLHEAMSEDLINNPGPPEGLPFPGDMDPVRVADLFDWSAGDDTADRLVNGGIAPEARETSFGDMWLSNAQVIYDATWHQGSLERKDMTAKELATYAIWTMARNKQNLLFKVGAVVEASYLWPPEQKVAWANLMHMYERVETWDGVVLSSSLISFAADPFIENILKSGVGRVGRKLRKKLPHGPPPKPSSIETLTNIFYRSMPLAWPEMVMGGLYTFVSDVADQKLEKEGAKGAFELSDPGQATLAAQDMGGGATRDDAEAPTGIPEFDVQRSVQNTALGAGAGALPEVALKAGHKVWRKIKGEDVSIEMSDVSALLSVLGLGGYGLFGEKGKPDNTPPEKIVDPGSPSA